jgi:large subunit ribosomal protein L21
MTFAVIKTGGKQYCVSAGDTLTVEKLDGVKEGQPVVFDQVLLVDNGKETRLGTPLVNGAKVSASLLEQGRAPKVVVIKFKSKTGLRKKYGHRQPYTKLKIEKIEF